MGEMLLMFGEDGEPRVYNPEFDVTIHCESEQEMDNAVALLHLANRMHWRKTAECPPKVEDTDPRSATVLTVQVGNGFVTAWEWHIVADFPEEFPIWMPMPELPKKGAESNAD